MKVRRQATCGEKKKAGASGLTGGGRTAGNNTSCLSVLKVADTRARNRCESSRVGSRGSYPGTDASPCTSGWSRKRKRTRENETGIFVGRMIGLEEGFKVLWMLMKTER